MLFTNLPKSVRLILMILAVTILAFGVRTGLQILMPFEESAAPPGAHKRSTYDVALDAVGNRVEGSYSLTDQDGNPFVLSDWLDKPLLVVYMFSSCKDVCPAIAGQLARVVADDKERLGTDFRILSIGFDTEFDSPAAMKKFGANFTSDFKNWKFVTGPKDDIRRLATILGVAYTKGPRGGWRHLVGFTLLAPGGVVFSQQFGVKYRAVDIFKAVERASGKQETPSQE